MEKVLNQLCERLRAASGGRLVSVVLYGSAASGELHTGFSDYNVLCVLSRVTCEEMKAMEPVFRWWRALGNPAPLLLGEGELAASADAFAIEFRDIRENHRILDGRDAIADIPLDDTFYRAQVEHELRSKLLRLRQKAAGMWSDTRLLRDLLADSVATFCVLFRHALRLRGVEAAVRKREVVAQAAEVFGIDPAPLTRLLDLREKRIQPGEVNPAALLPGYLAAISAVIEAVDRLEN